MTDELRGQEQEARPEQDSEEALQTTAEHWREGLAGTPAEDSASEVARGAEEAAEQPDWGREGS